MSIGRSCDKGSLQSGCDAGDETVVPGIVCAALGKRAGRGRLRHSVLTGTGKPDDSSAAHKWQCNVGIAKTNAFVEAAVVPSSDTRDSKVQSNVALQTTTKPESNLVPKDAEVHS